MDPTIEKMYFYIGHACFLGGIGFYLVFVSIYYKVNYKVETTSGFSSAFFCTIKSVNLQYNTMGRWVSGTNDSLAKHGRFQLANIYKCCYRSHDLL